MKNKIHFEVIHFDTLERTATVSIDEKQIELYVEIDHIDNTVCDIAADGEQDELVQEYYQDVLDVLQDSLSDHVSSHGAACHLRF